MNRCRKLRDETQQAKRGPPAKRPPNSAGEVNSTVWRGVTIIGAAKFKEKNS